MVQTYDQIPSKREDGQYLERTAVVGFRDIWCFFHLWVLTAKNMSLGEGAIAIFPMYKSKKNLQMHCIIRDLLKNIRMLPPHQKITSLTRWWHFYVLRLSN